MNNTNTTFSTYISNISEIEKYNKSNDNLRYLLDLKINLLNLFTPDFTKYFNNLKNTNPIKAENIINKTIELNINIDKQILSKLVNKINNILKNLLNSLPIDLKQSTTQSLANVDIMINEIYNELSIYYIDLVYCYGSLGTQYTKLSTNMFNYLNYKNKNINLTIDDIKSKNYYNYIKYNKCDNRFFYNIKCCIRAIIFLTIEFNYFNNVTLNTGLIYVNSSYSYYYRKTITTLATTQQIFINNLCKEYNINPINNTILTDIISLNKGLKFSYYFTNKDLQNCVL